tara:strand:- start:76 stop:750 length:675 start_codon:yes stop_codon:yes gene_type:complete
MSYLLYQEDKIVGVFDSHQKATDMAQGVIDNGWAKNFRVVEYKLNSCCKVKETKVDDDEDDDSTTTAEDIELNSEEIKKEKKEETQLQSQLNVLKMKKEKIEESKTKYEVDFKLYKEFKEKLETDNDFSIPELFIEKYKIFHQLDQEDNISWDSFSLLYKEPDFFGNYMNVFEVSNSFETKFLNDIDSDTESSLEEDSEDSDDSNSIIEIIQVVDSSDEDSSSD